MDLRDTVTLITGGGTGLGREIALQIGREGGHVAVNYSRSAAEAEQTVADLRALGVRAEAIQGDVASSPDATRIVQETVARLGRLDALVNNAGTTVFVPFQDLDGITEEAWDRIMAVNVKGAFLVSRAASKVMQPGGAIVNTTSVAGFQPSGSSLVYSCSKAALVHLTRGLAVALGPNVRVNSVAPGLLDTRWSQGFPPENFERYANRALLKKLPSLADTAAMAVALIKNDSVTGQTVIVDGGIVV